MKRRKFLEISSKGTVAVGLAPVILNTSRSLKIGGNDYEYGINPGMTEYKNVTQARPLLKSSQIQFRLDLVRQRLRSYPLDSNDFIMVDLERPDLFHKHADWCTGDQTGRFLEFLSSAEGIDGHTEPRMHEIFERVLRQRRASGLIGRYACQPKPAPPENDFKGGSERLFPGLIRYYELTRDPRALEAAVGIAKFALNHRDQWLELIKKNGARFYQAWISEPMALLYGLTKESSYLDFTAMIEEYIEPPDNGCHAHGYLSTLRGLQLAALITGDKGWNSKVERYRKSIIERNFIMPDGCVPEVFPPARRNEGCSIADWVILNLNAGLINGDEEAYAQADHAVWNALAFNQWITGAFGHREMTNSGYGLRYLEEAVWCCVYIGGLALATYARHAVSLKDETIHINLLLPGEYRLPIAGKMDAEVQILTSYPASPDTLITARHVPENFKINLRVPSCVKHPEISQQRNADTVVVKMKGILGHHLEQTSRGKMIYYGPLVLVPQINTWQDSTLSQSEKSNVSTGYIPGIIPEGLAELQVGEADADGFLHLSDQPLPDWFVFEEGPGSHFGISGAAVNIPVPDSKGRTNLVRFVPECYCTSNLTLGVTPIVFSGTDNVKKSKEPKKN
jgi:hypothetical protein